MKIAILGLASLLTLGVAAAAQEVARTVSPRLIREVKPFYPPAAVKAGIGGTVRLECVVLADGTVGDVHVLEGIEPEPRCGSDQSAQTVDVRPWLQGWHRRAGERQGRDCVLDPEGPSARVAGRVQGRPGRHPAQSGPRGTGPNTPKTRGAPASRERFCSTASSWTMAPSERCGSASISTRISMPRRFARCASGASRRARRTATRCRCKSAWS